MAYLVRSIDLMIWREATPVTRRIMVLASV